MITMCILRTPRKEKASSKLKRGFGPKKGEFMFIETLNDLEYLAKNKMSVCKLKGQIFSKEFVPARVLLNMSGAVIRNQFNSQLIIYKPKGK